MSYQAKPETNEPIQFGDPDLSDITLIIKEGEKEQKFEANKTVLANSSDYFKAMFYGQFKEAEQNCIEIKDVSINAFKSLLDLIYTGFADASVIQFKRENERNIPEGEDVCFICLNKRECSDNFCVQCSRNTKTTKTYRYYTVRGHPKKNDYSEMQHFWNSIDELLFVADRFNITPKLIRFFEEMFKNEICGFDNCLYCFNMYMLTVEHKMSILERFMEFSKENLQEWCDSVNPTTMKGSFRSLSIKELGNLFKKFSS